MKLFHVRCRVDDRSNSGGTFRQQAQCPCRMRIAFHQRLSVFISDRTAEATSPGIAMFTTENTEFTESKEHNCRCDSSVCSVYSVVKYVTRNRSMRTTKISRLARLTCHVKNRRRQLGWIFLLCPQCVTVRLTTQNSQRGQQLLSRRVRLILAEWSRYPTELRGAGARYHGCFGDQDSSPRECRRGRSGHSGSQTA